MINLETYLISNAPSYIEGAKYLNNLYNSNYQRFLKRFIEPLNIWLSMNNIENNNDICKIYINLFEKVSPYSYKEAFEIENDEFRALVFSAIDVPQMVKNLGSIRIKTKGIELINKVFNPITKTFKEEKFTQIYELHKVNCFKLRIQDSYAIKCWCTSTNEEHWLWISDKQAEKGCPLEAIASTCVIYKDMEGFIKYIIRQGDVFLFEMDDKFKGIKNYKNTKHLDKNIYFKLLKSQS